MTAHDMTRRRFTGLGGWLLRTLALLLALGCTALAAWPAAVNQYGRWQDAGRVQGYDRSVGDMDPEERSALITRCRTYNAWHRSYGIVDVFTHPVEDATADALLDALGAVDESGMLCVLEIPRLGVSLPVYRSTEARALDMGAAFVEGSSLPVGGDVAHTVLAARSGATDGRRFGRLNRMQVGDRFALRVLGETVKYTVDRVEILSIQEMGQFNQEDDGDCCTLVAQADGGERLLVRGRISRERLAAADDSVDKVPELAVIAMFAAPALAVGLVLLLLRELILRAGGRHRLRRLRKRMRRVRRT